MPNFKRSDPGRSKAAFRKQVHVIEFWGWDPASMRKQSDSHGPMGRLPFATSPAGVHATGQIGAENRPSLGEATV